VHRQFHGTIPASPGRGNPQFSIKPTMFRLGIEKGTITFRACRFPSGASFCETRVYRVSQEERSIFWEVIVSVILRNKVYMNMCPIPNVFWYLARNIFLPSHRKAPLSEACESVWSVSWMLWIAHRDGGKENIARWISETVRNRTHFHINSFLRMTDTMTSQNIDLSSWDTWL
jgi:hypothetical protein